MTWLLALLSGCTIRPEPGPRIGVTGTSEILREVLARWGAVPVALGPDGRSADEVLDDLDALVLGPGADLDPALYGQAPHETVVLLPVDRQDQDLALAKEAVRRDLPVLGVCLGAQELAVALGGGLIQDIPSQVPDPVDHRAPHPIAVIPETPLAGWLGTGPVEVTSRHHQAVDALPAGLVAAARSPDGVVEAFWAPERRLVVGVQYHPEEDDRPTHDRMWGALVEAARSRPATRGPRVEASTPTVGIGGDR